MLVGRKSIAAYCCQIANRRRFTPIYMQDIRPRRSTDKMSEAMSATLRCSIYNKSVR